MSLPPEDTSTRPRARVRRAALSVAMLAAVTAPSMPLPTAEASLPAAGAGTQASGSGHRFAGTHRITLLTGDLVALHVTPDGRQAAWVADPADDSAPPQIYQSDGDVHVVPAEAQPYVASGALDDKLFDVTLLAHEGFDDESTDQLPLLVEAPDRTRPAGVPDAPVGTDEVRELDSVDAVSVTADKTNIREAWKSIRGARQAASTTTDARLAGGRTVWLNGKVEATLDDSVAQIGAPDAWSAGYDGDGTEVAVLDTGYDPTHPDLAGRVAAAANFTDVPDPSGEVAVDGNGHGTHVASTVGGTGAASDGREQGVAPAADLLIGKVLDNEGSGSFDQIIAGMEWAVDQGADIVSMSLGTPWPSDGTDPMSQAVDRLTRSSDALFVIAAGNAGPAEQTVGTPGAADLALTVGAVDKDDDPAGFSSRGPRFGDGAIKPEITAPGVGIVAARAAGTSLGNLLDEYYTSLSGTSMATPHVAGAAALLAERHPDWTAARLKARLVSTSKTLDGQPVTFQGGGRVDVAAAVRDPISVDKGTAFLGRVSDTTAPVTRTLSYANASGRSIRLRLSADVTGTGADDSATPDLRLDRSLLTVPAHATARVTVTLRPAATDPGGYAGWIVARPLDGHRFHPVHTTLAFSVDGPTHTLTVEATDRDGRPASGPVDLWNAETGDYLRGFLADGSTSFEVPEGLYSVVATVEDAGPWFESTRHTVAGNPELWMSSDRTLRLDARDAKPVRVSTPRRADPDRFDVLWQRRVGGRSFSMITAQGYGDQQVFALKSPVARTGSFSLATEWQLIQPLLTARLAGTDGFQLTSPQLASEQATFVGERTLPLVDAGDGTSDAFADVDAEGSIALASRGPNWGDLQAQADAAAAAGAELLLVYNTSDESWTERLWDSPLPVYLVDHATGLALLDALDTGSEVALDLSGVRDSTYQYELAFAESRRIPSGASYHPDRKSLAVVESDYRQNSDRMIRAESWIPYFDGVGVGNSMATGRRGPLVRTDYVSTEGVQWQRFGQPSPWLGAYWTISEPMPYQAGRDYRQVWWGPLVHPAVPPAVDGTSSAPVLGNGYHPVTRYRDAIRINMPHYSYGGTLTGTIYEQFGDRSTLTLSRDGQSVGGSTWPTAQFTVPADEAEYELNLESINGDGNWSDTSVHTSTSWRFRSARADDSGEVLPLVQVDYGLNADAHNRMPSGASYPLVLDPGYQPGAAGPGGFTAEVEVSFDDGETWQSAPVQPADGRLKAQVPAATGPGYTSVRVVVTDAVGNRLTQQIDRAWKIAAP